MKTELPLLGTVEPDQVGQILGTGYMRFASPIGLCGLAKWSDERLDLLAVDAHPPGQGQFRAFIAAAKQVYKTICVWEDWNPVVGEALARYSFQRETEIQGDGEVLTGWRWDKPVVGKLK
jgi:hypothetical protein